MEYLKLFLTSFLSSSIVIGLFVFLTKKIISKEVELIFTKKNMITNHDVERSFKYDDIITDTCFGIYPEMLEMAYRIKRSFDNSINEDLAIKWKSDIKQLLVLFQENMIKYRAFIHNAIFDEMHLFKRSAQDIMIYYDILTREEFQFDINKNLEFRNEIVLKYNLLVNNFKKLEQIIRLELNKMRTIHV